MEREDAGQRWGGYPEQAHPNNRTPGEASRAYEERDAHPASLPTEVSIRLVRGVAIAWERIAGREAAAEEWGWRGSGRETFHRRAGAKASAAATHVRESIGGDTKKTNRIFGFVFFFFHAEFQTRGLWNYESDLGHKGGEKMDINRFHAGASGGCTAVFWSAPGRSLCRRGLVLVGFGINQVGIPASWALKGKRSTLGQLLLNALPIRSPAGHRGCCRTTNWRGKTMSYSLSAKGLSSSTGQRGDSAPVRGIAQWV